MSEQKKMIAPVELNDESLENVSGGTVLTTEKELAERNYKCKWCGQKLVPMNYHWYCNNCHDMYLT